MKFKEFDRVRLSDNRIGNIVDILNNGEAYIVEIDPGEKDVSFDDWLPTVYASEIDEVLT